MSVILSVMIWLRENEQQSAQCFFLSPGGDGRVLRENLNSFAFFPLPWGERMKVRGIIFPLRMITHLTKSPILIPYKDLTVADVARRTELFFSPAIGEDQPEQ